jgi:hypothetical protein
MKMNLRNALVVFFVGLFFTLAAGQETTVPPTSSPDKVSENTADEVSSDSGDGKSGAVTVFFTGFLLGYYRLPQWQSADFEPACPNADDDNRDWRARFKLQDTEPNSLAKQFTDLLNSGTRDGIQFLEPRQPGDLLLGMGDNFGVALESRTYRPEEDKLWKLSAKSHDMRGWRSDSPEYKPTATDPRIGDNVGCFLYRAGYDAVVPGKHDFYFGPGRLKQIADRMAAAPVIPGNLDPLRVLAANLVIKTDPIKKPPDILDSDKKDLKFLPGLPSGVKSLDAKDNGTVMPFTRRLRFQLPSLQDPRQKLPIFLCPLDYNQGLDALDPTSKKCQQRPPSAWEEEPQVSSVKSDQSKLVVHSDADSQKTWDFILPPDWPPAGPRNSGVLFGLCTQGATESGSKPEQQKASGQSQEKDKDGKDKELQLANKKYYCLRLTVAEPLFGTMADAPYVVKRIRHTGKPDAYAVVVGIVDPDLASLVGRDNLSWRNDQPELEPKKTASASKVVPEGKEAYSTTVRATDPAAAIGLALRHFELVGRSGHGIEPGAKIFKILLAQMERGKAETLAANLANTRLSGTPLNFDLVLSSAADFSAATADEQVHFEPSPFLDSKANKSGKQPRFRHFVVVPWRAYDYANHRLPDPLRIVTLSDDSCHDGLCWERNFTVGGQWNLTFPLPAINEEEKLKGDYEQIGLDHLRSKGYWPLSDSPSASLDGPFPLAVLDTLRSKTGADVAMLQKRDFYWGPFSTPLLTPPTKHPNGVLLDSILWTGDYLQVLTLKGDTLKKVLDDSAKLDALDAQATNASVETKRGLITWGIQKTRDKQYLVDGTQLDPNRLYTVATSNHIGAGDTGYPELADPQFSDAKLPRSGKSSDEGETTQRLSSIICRELKGENCVDSPALTFATIQRLPPQLEPTLLARVNAWGRSFVGRPELLTDAASSVDYEAQLEPTWRFSLKDLSLNLSAVRNNLSEVQRSTELAAVTEPAAGAVKGHKVDYSAHVEFVRSAKSLDEFIRGLTEYKSTVTAATTTLTATTTVPVLPTVSRSKNRGAIDAGFFLHFHKHKYESRWGLVLEPFHFETPMHREEVLVNTSFDKTTNNPINPAFILPLDRKRQFLGRLAFRIESSKSSIELGYQGGWEKNALTSLTSNAGNCDELATQPLNACLKNLQKMAGFNFRSIRQLNATRQRNGPYVNLDWTIPVIWRFSLRTEDYGTYYRPAHLDNSTDTLYLNDAKETLKFTFPFLPNLALGPGLERIDYENKLEHVHLRTWGPVFSVTYNFDRYSGGNWKKSLGYSSSGSGTK